MKTKKYIPKKLTPAPTWAAKLLAAMTKMAQDYPGQFIIIDQKTFKPLGVYWRPRGLHNYRATLPKSINTILFRSTAEGLLHAGNFE